LYRRDEPDFDEFTLGRRFSEEDVYAQIGQPKDWSHRSAAKPHVHSEDDAAAVAEQLLLCRTWTPQPWFTTNEDRY
jgi:hypothetical protein